MLSSDRIAVVLDLENLVGLPPIEGRLSQLIAALARIVEGRTVVAAVGYCATPLQRRLLFKMQPLGVRIFGHSERMPDAADRLLLRHLEAELPASVDTVVIGSGDHIFAPSAATLRARNLRVEVAARPGTLSADLYKECSCWHPIGNPYAPSPIPHEPTRLVA